MGLKKVVLEKFFFLFFQQNSENIKKRELKQKTNKKKTKQAHTQSKHATMICVATHTHVYINTIPK